MAVDMFINLGSKIAGETKDDAQKSKKDCDVLAFSFGMSQTGNMHVGGGGGAGKVNVQDFSFTKWVDSASGPLMAHCCGGDHIPEIVLLVRKAGGKQEKYITMTMKRCIITSVSTGGSGGEDRLTEHVSINFAEFLYEYFVQDEKGATKPSGKCGWNIEANKKTA